MSYSSPQLHVYLPAEFFLYIFAVLALGLCARAHFLGFVLVGVLDLVCLTRRRRGGGAIFSMLWQLLPAVAVVGAVAVVLAAINAGARAGGDTAAAAASAAAASAAAASAAAASAASAAAASAAAASGFGVSTAAGLAACRVVLSRLAVLDSVGLRLTGGTDA